MKIEQSSRDARILALAELIDGLIEGRVEEIRRRYEGTDTDRLRAMYRRGYHAGYETGRRRAPEVTNPERHARGEARELLNGR